MSTWFYNSGLGLYLTNQLSTCNANVLPYNIYSCNGLIGINDSNPMYNLDVNSNIHASYEVIAPYLVAQSNVTTSNLTATGMVSGLIGSFSNLIVTGLLSGNAANFTGVATASNLSTSGLIVNGITELLGELIVEGGSTSTFYTPAFFNGGLTANNSVFNGIVTNNGLVTMNSNLVVNSNITATYGVEATVGTFYNEYVTGNLYVGPTESNSILDVTGGVLNIVGPGSAPNRQVVIYDDLVVASNLTVNSGTTIYGDLVQNTSVDGGATAYLNNITSSGVLGGSSLGGTSNAAFWASNAAGGASSAAYYASNAAGGISSNAGNRGLVPVLQYSMPAMTGIIMDGFGVTTVYDGDIVVGSLTGNHPAPICYNGYFLYDDFNDGICSNARFVIKGNYRASFSGSNNPAGGFYPVNYLGGYISQFQIQYCTNLDLRSGSLNPWNNVNTTDGSNGAFQVYSYGNSNGPTTACSPWFTLPFAGSTVTNSAYWLGMSVADSNTQNQGFYITSMQLQVA